MSQVGMNSPDCAQITLPDRLIGSHVRDVLEQLRAAQDAGASAIVLDASRVRVLGVAGAQLMLSALRTLEGALMLLTPHPSFIGTLSELGMWDELSHALCLEDPTAGEETGAEEGTPAEVEVDLGDWDMGSPDATDASALVEADLLGKGDGA